MPAHLGPVGVVPVRAGQVGTRGSRSARRHRSGTGISAGMMSRMRTDLGPEPVKHDLERLIPHGGIAVGVLRCPRRTDHERYEFRDADVVAHRADLLGAS